MSEPISRRTFLVRLATVSAAALVAPSIGSADASGAWVAIGPASQYKKGDFTRVVLPGSRAIIYVTQKPDNSYLALSAYCTHRGCAVDWTADQKQFVCPCHGGRYDTAGNVVSGPPPTPLPSLATKVDAQGNLNVQPPTA